MSIFLTKASGKLKFRSGSNHILHIGYEVGFLPTDFLLQREAGWLLNRTKGGILPF